MSLQPPQPAPFGACRAADVSSSDAVGSPPPPPPARRLRPRCSPHVRPLRLSGRTRTSGGAGLPRLRSPASRQPAERAWWREVAVAWMGSRREAGKDPNGQLNMIFEFKSRPPRRPRNKGEKTWVDGAPLSGARCDGGDDRARHAGRRESASMPNIDGLSSRRRRGRDAAAVGSGPRRHSSPHYDHTPKERGEERGEGREGGEI